MLRRHALCLSDGSSLEDEKNEREQEYEVDGGKGGEAGRVTDARHQGKSIEADVESVAWETDQLDLCERGTGQNNAYRT